MITMSRECTNCCEVLVDESKQNFIYRDWQGNKYDACIRPVCNLCIEAGSIVNEFYSGRMVMRLYLGASRLYKPDDDRYNWWE